MSEGDFHIIFGKPICLRHEFTEHIVKCAKGWAHPSGYKRVMMCKNCGKRDEKNWR